MRRTLLTLSVVALLVLSVSPAVPASAQTTVDGEPWFTACHRLSDGTYHIISFPLEVEVPQWRIDAHRAHGARYPGESIPSSGAPGYYLNEDCERVSWLIGETLNGCVETDNPNPCLSCEASNGGIGCEYEPSGNLFLENSAPVRDPGAEFTTADGAVTADFDGDHLTITIAPGQPELYLGRCSVLSAEAGVGPPEGRCGCSPILTPRGSGHSG